MQCMKMGAKYVVSRKTGLMSKLTPRCFKYTDGNVINNSVGEIEVNDPDKIDEMEEKLKSDQYNELFFRLHNQEQPAMHAKANTGVDIDSFEAIESYEKLFYDSYKKHKSNCNFNEMIPKSPESENFDSLNAAKKVKGYVFVGEDIMNNLIKSNDNIATVAEIAGIMGAKKTSELIPKYFSTIVHKVEIDIDFDVKEYEVVVTATAVGDNDCRTKALVGCTVALTTIVDHFKDVSNDLHIRHIHFTG